MGRNELVTSAGFWGHMCFHQNFRNKRYVTNMVARWNARKKVLEVGDFLCISFYRLTVFFPPEDHQSLFLRVCFPE